MCLICGSRSVPGGRSGRGRSCPVDSGSASRRTSRPSSQSHITILRIIAAPGSTVRIYLIPDLVRTRRRVTSQVLATFCSRASFQSWSVAEYVLPAAHAPAAAAAGTALTALAGTAAGASAAAAHPAAGAKGLTGPICTTDRAGYRAGFATGRRFRWVTTTFTVPNCADASASHGWTDNGAALGATGQTGARVKAGCASDGTGASVAYQLTTGGTPGAGVTLPITPNAAHSVTASIYHDRAPGVLRFTVTDNTTGDSLVRAVGVGTGIDYLGAGAGSFFDPGAVTAPPTDVRTGAFSGTHLTSCNVTRGTLLGPWPTSQIIATISGSADGKVVANAPVLFNGGQNFGVWERTTAHP